MIRERASPPPPDDARYLTAFRERLQGLLARNDYLALGNTVIETLMRPGQDKSPDGRSQVLDEFMPQVVRQFCSLPEGLYYTRPYSDEHLEFSDRDTWEKDRFVELVIHAYIVGSSITKLPPPYGYHVRLYKCFGVRQQIAFAEATLKHLDSEKPQKPDQYPGKCHACWTCLLACRDLVPYLDQVEQSAPAPACPPAPRDWLLGWLTNPVRDDGVKCLRGPGDPHRFADTALSAFTASVTRAWKAGNPAPPSAFSELHAALKHMTGVSLPEARRCAAAFKRCQAWESSRREAERSLRAARQSLDEAEDELEEEERKNRAREKAERERLQAVKAQEEAERRRAEAERLARERAEAEAGIGDSDLARQIRGVKESGLDASLIEAEIEYLRKKFRTGGAK